MDIELIDSYTIRDISVIRNWKKEKISLKNMALMYLN